MDPKRFDAITKALYSESNRRRTLSGLLGGALATLGRLGFADVEAKKGTKTTRGGHGGHGGKRNEPKRKVCICSETSCRSQKKPRSKIKKLVKRNPCAYRGGCTGVNPCAVAQAVRVSAPFRIDAIWTGDPDYDTFLFVPKASAAANPGPFIKYDCNPDSDCEVEYPFACVSQDATGPGNEITTVHQLLAGTYEYWIQVETMAPAGELTVQLVKDGSVLATWHNPANPSGSQEIGWHVFNIDGGSGTVTSAGETINDTLPDAAHLENEDVCP